jgi:hypothetical protein
MLRWLGGVVDRILVVLGAFLFSQFPAFLQQYSQRLGGHLAELNRQILELQRLAMQSGKTLPAYIHKFSSSGDSDFSRHGAQMQKMLERQVELSDALNHLTHATLWTKPVAFIQHLQWEIAQGTLSLFQPGLSLTMEGLVYAAMGMVVGYCFFTTLHRLWRKIASAVT